MSGINKIQGDQSIFNLAKLEDLSQGLKPSDVVRGKSNTVSKGFFTKTSSEVTTLYKKTKAQGNYKKQERGIKQEKAREHILLALKNTAKEIPNLSPLQREKLTAAFTSIHNSHIANTGDVTGLTLTNIVADAKLAIEMVSLEKPKELSKADTELLNLRMDDLAALVHNPYNTKVKCTPEARMRIQELITVTKEEALQGHLNNDPLRYRHEREDQNKLLTQVFVLANVRPSKEGGTLSNPDIHFASMLITEELESTKSNKDGTIFRGNSLTTRYITGFCMSHGGAWLKNMLDDVIGDICKKPPFQAKTDDKPENLKKEVQGFNDVYSKLMNRVLQSVDQLPKELCNLVNLTYKSIKANNGSDETARNGSIGIIILRLLCPIITSPQNCPVNFDKFDKNNVSLEARAYLIKLASIIQAKSNNTELKQGKAHLNEVVSGNSVNLETFFNDVIKRGDSPPPIQKFPPIQGEVLEELIDDEEPLEEIHENNDVIENNKIDYNDEHFVENMTHEDWEKLIH